MSKPIINEARLAAVEVKKSGKDFSVMVQAKRILDGGNDIATGFFSREELLALQAAITEALEA